ncbi:hypothetical protein BDZ91DRAFT_708790 [Kalaharituber pfeilii]|nr:hypothetical protein BDZ91DRAFT_708790 [Kalaharituber pfeilii]
MPQIFSVHVLRTVQSCMKFKPLRLSFASSQISCLDQIRYSSHKSAKALKARKTTRAAKPESQKVPEKKATIASIPNKTQAAAVPAPGAQAMPQFMTLAENLAKSRKPTLLYKKNHGRFIIGCYCMAGLGLFVMANSYYANIVLPIGVKTWVKVTHFIGIALVGVVSIAFLIYPTRLIRSIHAVPLRVSPHAQPTLKLDIESTNFIPFLRPIRTITPLNEVYLSRKLAGQSTLSSKWIKPTGALARLGYHINNASERAFLTAKNMVTRQKFVPMHIKSKSFGLVLNEEGWQWEKNGLNRLVGIKRKW